MRMTLKSVFLGIFGQWDDQADCFRHLPGFSYYFSILGHDYFEERAMHTVIIMVISHQEPAVPSSSFCTTTLLLLYILAFFLVASIIEIQ